MKTFILTLFTLVLSLNVYSQSQSQMDRNRNRNRIPQSEPSQQQIEAQKREIEERKDEYIANFLTTLEGDDFQKEIVKQTLNSFYDKRMALYQVRYERSIDRKDAANKLEESHFKELRELISEADMAKISEMIAGEFDEKEVKKKKKEKKKKKRKKNKS